MVAYRTAKTSYCGLGWAASGAAKAAARQRSTRIPVVYSGCVKTRFPMQRLAHFRWLYPLFFLSGFPALLYQIVWQRALFAIYGVNIEQRPLPDDLVQQRGK